MNKTGSSHLLSGIADFPPPSQAPAEPLVMVYLSCLCGHLPLTLRIPIHIARLGLLSAVGAPVCGNAPVCRTSKQQRQIECP